MTRKDYEAIAAALRASAHKEAGDALVYDSKRLQHRSCCAYVADALARDNARFNRERFMAACGVEG